MFPCNTVSEVSDETAEIMYKWIAFIVKIIKNQYPIISSINMHKSIITHSPAEGILIVSMLESQESSPFEDVHSTA